MSAITRAIAAARALSARGRTYGKEKVHGSIRDRAAAQRINSKRAGSACVPVLLAEVEAWGDHGIPAAQACGEVRIAS